MFRTLFRYGALLAIALFTSAVTGCGSDEDASGPTTCSVGGVIYQPGELLPWIVVVRSQGRDNPAVDVEPLTTFTDKLPPTWPVEADGEIARLGVLCGEQAVAVRLWQRHQGTSDRIEVRLEGEDLPDETIWRITGMRQASGAFAATQTVMQPLERGVQHVVFILDQFAISYAVVSLEFELNQKNRETH